MSVALRVHVGDTPDELLKNVLALVGRQTLIRHLLDVMKDARSLAQFHDQVDVGAHVYDLVQLHDVWVP